MKKVTLRIKKVPSDSGDMFCFYGDADTQLFSVSCKDKKISGKDLFNSIYSKATLDDPIQVEIDPSELSKEDQKQFGNYVVDLFTSINKAMTEQLKPNDIQDNDRFPGQSS